MTLTSEEKACASFNFRDGWAGPHLAYIIIAPLRSTELGSFTKIKACLQEPNFYVPFWDT